MNQSRRSCWRLLLVAGLLTLAAASTMADEPPLTTLPPVSKITFGLTKPVDVKFEKQTLEGAVKELAEQSGLVILWDAAIDQTVKEVVVTLQASGIRAGTVLGEILKPRSLTLRVDHDALMIVRQEAPARQLDEYFPRPSRAEVKILEALDKPSTVEFNETPLAEALQQVVKDSDINLVADAMALTDMVRDSKVNLVMKDARLGSILKTMLRDRELTFIIEDDALRVTTPLIAGSQFMIRTYPVGDLLSTPDEMKALIQSLEKTVDLATWERQGGQGNIAAANNSKSLVISQTWHGHQKILDLLRVLRQAKEAR